jgi:hypothetical protein
VRKHHGVNMSEENKEALEQKTYTQAELDEIVGGLKNKVDELLGEKKTVAQKAAELESKQQELEEARLKEKEEFKTLWEREQDSKRELQEKYHSFEKQVKDKELESASLSVAAQLTRDTKRAELLKKEISQFARYTDNGVIYEIGGVEVDQAKVVEHVKNEYPFLVDGVNSSGSGAAGSSSSRASNILKIDSTKTERAEYFKNKYKL